MAALKLGDHINAARLFESAAALDPKAAALWRNAATAYRAMDDAQGERRALEGALGADQRDFLAWLRKAELHQRFEQEAEALAAWQAALALADQAERLPEALTGPLAAGRTFVAGAKARIRAAADAALAEVGTGLNEGEARRLRAMIEHAHGARPIYLNQCAGLHYPFLPADEFFDRAHFPWLADFEASAPAIRAELEALLAGPGDALRPYVRMDKGTPDNLWSGLDNSLAWGACFLWEYGEANGPVIERCPLTAAALAAIPGAAIPERAPNAFFSLLRPRTRIPAHTGVTNTRAIIHLPLIVPRGCGFRVGGETREWVEGTAFAFDDTIEHEAWNDSDELRAVLICDVWNPHLSEREREAILAYYAAADATGFNPARTGD
ncbi:MAG: Aspartyl/Asparaginyl beta-hydroxylase [uncultured Sphingosinicella sp.]|uniref:Aspartyl/Asparaginyl beta-hydroxylase n=1 Tax=uncultured Sphingosinicella sp. TaxID=478748 RepID=A0A6J4UCX5_9SPHN|nr:MAG: Aspartyl/Asparaginyl beta-hydroxylase [uncultured Sphingosinicella sp.]